LPIAYAETYQSVMKPPSTQKSREAPTLLVAWMMVDGVEKMPVPIMRFTIKRVVEVTPSFRSV